MKWRWIEREALLLLHDQSLAEHGGPAGIRDAHLLDSALARPQQLAHYGKPDWADLAACYATGLAKNHPFVDGNKRAAFVATGLFMHLNGWRLTSPQAHAVLAVLAIASGEWDERTFAHWLRENSRKR